MREILRTIARELGLTVRCAIVLVLALAAVYAAAIWDVAALTGVAWSLAFVAGTLWDRETQCDACGEILEDREPTAPNGEER